MDTEEKVLEKADRDALSLFKKAEYTKAEEILCTVLEAQKSPAGVENLNALTTKHNLAGVLYAQGKYTNAEKVLRSLLEVHERYEQMLKPNHPDTENIRSCLAECLVAQGKPPTEGILLRSSRARYERVLEAGDFRLLTGNIWDWPITSPCR